MTAKNNQKNIKTSPMSSFLSHSTMKRDGSIAFFYDLPHEADDAKAEN